MTPIHRHANLETYIRLKWAKLIKNFKENTCSVEGLCSTPAKNLQGHN